MGRGFRVNDRSHNHRPIILVGRYGRIDSTTGGDVRCLAPGWDLVKRPRSPCSPFGRSSRGQATDRMSAPIRDK